MFEHSVKVPRHYKKAANLLYQVASKGASLKTLLYAEEGKLKHFRTNVLYALVSETLKHNVLLDDLFEYTKLLKNEPRFNPWLAKILTMELLFGKKSLPGNSKPETVITAYKEKFEKFPDLQSEYSGKKVQPKPRYVRINTNILMTSDAIHHFQEEGYNFIRCTSKSYNDFLEQVKCLQEYDFMQDFHVKSLFVFAPGTKFHDHEFYLNGQILLQDKATTLSAHLLAPLPGSVVLDMCAAPGMKTSHLAAIMKNQGKIYAVERDQERFKTLQTFIENTQSTCVEVINKDVFEIRRGELSDVEYILLDPSCSGSGMDISMYKYKEEGRVAKLTSLQEKLLKHAMYAFPKAKRIIYSTCSIFPEENERVVTNAVQHCKRAKWRVQNTKELLNDEWNNFGSGMYGSIGSRCLYARPDSDLTTGFFLAVLDRDPKYFEKNCSFNNNEDNIKSDNKEKLSKSKLDKRKKKKKNCEENTDNILEKSENNWDFSINQDISDKPRHKKSKKEKKGEENVNPEKENTIDEPVNKDYDDEQQKKRKKKNSKSKVTEHTKAKETFDLLETSVDNKKNKRNQKVYQSETIKGSIDQDLNHKMKKSKNKINDIAKLDVSNTNSEKVPKKKRKNSTVELVDEYLNDEFTPIKKKKKHKSKD